MKYAHRFTVNAPLARVAEFHHAASSMAAITPPPIVVQMHESPDQLFDGAEVGFTLWMLVLPIRWRARMENVGNTGFWDRQIRGPYGAWLHKHTFIPLDDNRTEVLDEIEAKPGTGFWGRLLSLGMWANMPLLFAYRGWRTRRLLETTVPIETVA
ncbi:MAG: hypothetical protein WDZ49_04560 [Litorilinea sp.]